MLNKAFRLLLFFCIALIDVNAQTLTKSPYSALGLGDLQFGGNAIESALGQCSQGIRKIGDINNQNPASYGSLKYTVIEAGFKYSLGTIQNSTSNSDIDNYSYGYLSVGIPLSQKLRWGMSFGVQPVSSIGYTVSANTDYSSQPGGFPATLQTSGRGGLSRIYFGSGIAILRDLSIGVNASYLWGQMITTKSIYIDPSYNRYNIEEISSTYVGDLYFDYGIQYHHIIKDKNKKPKYKLVIGATLNLATKVNATKDYSARSMGVGGILATKDTISYQTDQKGTVNFPLMYKVGISFEETDHWMICADVNMANWSTYQFFGTTDSLKNMLGLSFGASYLPDKPDVISNYMNHIEYRIGARYDNGYLNVNGTDITTYGISGGMGFPVGKLKSKINLTAEYFVRGTTNNNLIHEEYFRIILGITFNDKWFDRYKFY